MQMSNFTLAVFKLIVFIGIFSTLRRLLLKIYVKCHWYISVNEAISMLVLQVNAQA